MITSLALVLAGLSVGLLLAEGLARLTWSEPVLGEKGLGPAVVDPSLPTIHSVLELARPNQRAIHNGRRYRTNSLGVRGPEYPLEPPSDVFRIAIGGDSVTMGAGVDEDDAYSRALERLLEGRSDRWRYEVINLGISGINTGAVVNRMRRIGLRYHPRLLVYGFTPNDLEGPGYQKTVRSLVLLQYQKRYERVLTSPSYLVRLAGPRLLALRDRFNPPEGSYLRELQLNYFENPAAWGEFTAQLGRFASMATAQGLCGHVFLHRQQTRLKKLDPFVPIYDKVAAAAEDLGLTVSHSDAYMGTYDDESLRINMFDQHPSPLGHRLYAQALLDGLLALPDRCWRAPDGSSARPVREVAREP